MRVLCAAWVLLAAACAASASGPPVPPFPPRAEWIGAPQSWEALHGKVVLLDVWTFG